MFFLIIVSLLFGNSQPQRLNVLHQCVHPANTTNYECVFKIKDKFYFCGGEFHKVNQCATNLEKMYESYRFNYVPYTLLWSPDISAEYSEIPVEIKTPKYFQRTN
jgi:hypothetical protein